MSTEDQYTEQKPEQEIDLIELILKVWDQRKKVLRITCVFFLAGLLVAIFSPKEYTAGCILIPQSGAKGATGNLGGLAALAGINLGSMGSSEALPPSIYPKIMKSIPFQQELMRTTVHSERSGQPVAVLDYFTDSRYQSFSLLGFLKKYTIGLPGVLSGAFRSTDAEQSDPASAQSPLYVLTPKERACAVALSGAVTLTIDSKDGLIELKARMPEAYAAAELAESTQLLLQKYITEFKIEKVQSNLDFVQERYGEARDTFEQIQAERALFRDANQQLTSARALTEQEKYDARYNLALSVYTELAKQLEQAKIQVKETTPILMVVDPVVVPLEKSKPKRSLILIGFIFVGLVAGAGAVLMPSFFSGLGVNRRGKETGSL
ncbi:MAG: lipopolysaccharide biosynthesis protein [Culturomica sp.]|jgi:LPS O-antigen subunit length determinant protein (WzzB/FepE family)|nr:lipopolysaccharide biosynthesis protein [Culturomica sp.]